MWETLAGPPVDWLGTFNSSLRSGPQFYKTPEPGYSVQQEKQRFLITRVGKLSPIMPRHVSIAAPSPKDSHYSSAPFFIAAGYKKRLVTSESCQIQGLSSEATIMTIIDFQSKVANRSTTHWMLLEGEKSGFLEKHQLLIGNVVWHMYSV